MCGHILSPHESGLYGWNLVAWGIEHPHFWVAVSALDGNDHSTTIPIIAHSDSDPVYMSTHPHCFWPHHVTNGDNTIIYSY